MGRQPCLCANTYADNAISLFSIVLCIFMQNQMRIMQPIMEMFLYFHCYYWLSFRNFSSLFKMLYCLWPTDMSAQNYWSRIDLHTCSLLELMFSPFTLFANIGNVIVCQRSTISFMYFFHMWLRNSSWLKINLKHWCLIFLVNFLPSWTLSYISGKSESSALSNSCQWIIDQVRCSFLA